MSFGHTLRAMVETARSPRSRTVSDSRKSAITAKSWSPTDVCQVVYSAKKRTESGLRGEVGADRGVQQLFSFLRDHEDGNRESCQQGSVYALDHGIIL